MLMAAPEVSEVSAVAGAGGIVTVTYTLSGAPAIVTFDVLEGETSIGERNLWYSDGAVCRKVVTDGEHTFTWDARKSWPNANASVKVKVTAWDPGDPPDIIVADLCDSNSNVWYYASTNAMPGGLLENKYYRTSAIVLKRIRAKGVAWTMGDDPALDPGAVTPSSNGYAEPHEVTLTNDFYMGVFELTQAQERRGDRTADTSFFTSDFAMRPTENRQGYQLVGSGTTHPSNPVSSNGWLAWMRNYTGLEGLYYPGEAQWEFAARGGHGHGYWGDGTKMASDDPAADPGLAARYGCDAATTDGAVRADAGGTAIVGSYPPNGYGLYDMAGNVREMTVDLFQSYADIPDEERAVGAINNVDGYTLDGKTKPQYSIFRGGGWCDSAKECHPGYRWHGYANGNNKYSGFRISMNIGDPAADYTGPSSAPSSVFAINTAETASHEGAAGALEARGNSLYESLGIDLITKALRGLILFVR